MKELKSKRLFTLTIKLQPMIELGDTPAGKRRVFVVTGGEFEGDRIRGTVMPIIGSDLLLLRADGSAQQDVRMLLKTDDAAIVLMTYRGVRHASREAGIGNRLHRVPLRRRPLLCLLGAVSRRRLC